MYLYYTLWLSLFAGQAQISAMLPDMRFCLDFHMWFAGQAFLQVKLKMLLLYKLNVVSIHATGALFTKTPTLVDYYVNSLSIWS